MEFNKNSKLFIRNVFSYDIPACHYQVVKKLGLDISKLNENDKTQRNIQIGLMMRDNPKLVNVIRKTTESIIDEYLTRNNLTNDDLIIRQYDGFLTQKSLKITSLSIPIELKDTFTNMIISFDRKMYIAKGNKIVIKGMPRKYDGINNIIEKIVGLDFINKDVIFSSLQKIKDEFFSTEDPRIFSIPVSDDKDKCNIIVKKYGEIEVSKGILDSMDIDDIDKRKYYEFYIMPFTKSIILEFM